MSDFVLCVSDS